MDQNVDILFSFTLNIQNKKMVNANEVAFEVYIHPTSCGSGNETNHDPRYTVDLNSC